MNSRFSDGVGGSDARDLVVAAVGLGARAEVVDEEAAGAGEPFEPEGAERSV